MTDKDRLPPSPNTSGSADGREPGTPEEAKQLVQKLLETGSLTVQDLYQLAAERRKTELAAMQVVAETTEKQEKMFSFADTAALLKKEGVCDLEAERAEAVRIHEQIGLVQALMDKGVVAGTEQYAALFDGCEFTENGVQEMIGRSRGRIPGPRGEYYGPREIWTPAFNPGHMLPLEILRLLFPENTSHMSRSDASRFEKVLDEETGKIESIRRISAKEIDFKRLEELRTQIPEYNYWECIERSCTSAYDKSPALQPDVPSILFVEDKAQPVYRPNDDGYERAKSPFSLLRDIYEGKRRFIDPITDWILFRAKTVDSDSNWSKSLGQEKDFRGRLEWPTVQVLYPEYFLHGKVAQSNFTGEPQRRHHLLRFVTPAREQGVGNQPYPRLVLQ